MTQVVKINIANTQYEIISELADDFKYEAVSDSNIFTSDIIWQDNAITPDSLSQLTSNQRVNHFPGMFIIARKDFLGKNLKSMRSVFPKSFNFFPPTWILPRDFPDLKSQFNEKRAKTFICKPEALSQGKGIFLTRNIEEIPEKCVVQRYLHRPFLIEGLKFDLRVYVLVTSCDPLRIYIHKEGLVRLATEPYTNPTPSNLDNVCMHLTNYAINKNSSKFEFNSDPNQLFMGHKRSLAVFMDWLKEQGHDSDGIWKDIGGIIVKTLCVAQPTLSHLYRSSQPNDLTSSICFQILGFDIFINDKLRPILLEVNHTPSFTTDTPLDLLIKKKVIGDAIKMLGMDRRVEVKVNRGNKGIKEMRAMKNDAKEKWNQIRAEIEEGSKGGYTRIYPACEGQADNDEFEEIMATARDLWLTNVGVRKKRSRENSLVAVKQPASISPTKHLNSFTPVQGNYPARETIKTKRDTGKSKQTFRNAKVIDSQEKVPTKLPAIKLAFGSYLQPRIFDFSDSKQTIVINKEEKQG